MKQSVSAVYITKNAQKTLAKSLHSISFVDEIIIVDSGSTDQTRQIAEQFNARFISNPWPGFGKQKQFAIEQAQHQWVLCLDDDEIVTEALKISIQNTLNQPSYYAYQAARSNYFMGCYLKHGEGYPDWSLRLFNKQYAHWSEDTVHEYVMTHTEKGRLNGDLLHYSCDSLTNYLNKQNQYTRLQAEKIIASGKKIGFAKIIINPLFRFIKFFFLKRGFLDGVPGFVHISIGCFNTMMKYAKVYEQQKETHK